MYLVGSLKSAKHIPFINKTRHILYPIRMWYTVQMANIGNINLEPRVVKPPLNWELGLLAQGTKGLLLKDNMALCYSAPLNFAGSLLLAQQKDVFINAITTAGYRPSEELLNPIDHMKNVQVSGTACVTGEMVIKKVCGVMNVGLVTTGPLSGLLVTDGSGWDRPIDRLAYPVRIFNDEPLPSDPMRYHPYPPRFLEINGVTVNEPIKGTPVESFHNELYERFKVLYADYANNLKIKLGYPERLFVSDMLFDLCEQMGIPVDRQNFHYTRTQNLM